MSIINIHRGDDTDAFGGNLISITYETESNPIKSIEISIGNIRKHYDVPTFPLNVNLSSSETLSNPIGEYSLDITVYDNDYKRLSLSPNISVYSWIQHPRSSRYLTNPWKSTCVLYSLPMRKKMSLTTKRLDNIRCYCYIVIKRKEGDLVCP